MAELAGDEDQLAAVVSFVRDEVIEKVNEIGREVLPDC